MGQDDPITASARPSLPRRSASMLPSSDHWLPDVFSALTRDDLLGYYRARYVPNNLVVVVVGAFDPAATRDAIARHFGSAPRARLPRPDPRRALPAGSSRVPPV